MRFLRETDQFNPLASLAVLIAVTFSACGGGKGEPDASAETPWTVERIEEGWVHVPAGSFVYGASEKPKCWGLESVQAEVVLTRGFVISPTEVTRTQWRAVGFPDPSPADAPECDGCPVGRVNWYEALAYVNALSRKAGLPECYRLENCVGTIGAGCPAPNDSSPAAQEWDLYGCAGEARFVASYYICEWPVHRYPDRYSCPGYRLPTAAEWQYAARAGTNTDTYGGDVGENNGNCEKLEVLEPIAWYCHNSEDHAHPVGQKKPNPWGLYDMIGNQWEFIDHIASGLPLENDESHAPPLVDPIGHTEPESFDYERFGIKGGAWPVFYSACRCNTHAVFDSSSKQRLNYYGFRPVRTIFDSGPGPDGGVGRALDKGPAPAAD